MPFFFPEGTGNGNDPDKEKLRPAARKRMSHNEIIAHLEKWFPCSTLEVSLHKSGLS